MNRVTRLPARRTRLDPDLLIRMYGARVNDRARGRLVEYHHLGDERLHVPHVRQPAPDRERAEVLRDVTQIVGLVIVLRKKLQQTS